MVIFKIGIDDTDTNLGYCTTFIAALLLEEALKIDLKIVDFPYLIRLNPNIPFKTRGNAAVALKFSGNIGKAKILFQKFQEICSNLIEEDKQKPNPVIALYSGNDDELNLFYRKALVKKVDIEEAIELAKKLDIKYLALRNEIGLIGALAAIGADLEDFTYELLAYRNPNETSRERGLNYEKVLEMDFKFKEYTFHNIDIEKKRILITPHGRDPVIVGIRGKDPDKLIEAFKFLEINAERWLIFKTNQGTDAHLKEARTTKSWDKYSVIYEEAIITENPIIIKGGHVMFGCIIAGKNAKVLVYNESGKMNKLARYLNEGDLVRIGGAVKDVIDNTLIINSEKIEILYLKEILKKKRPPCSKCGSRLKSAGSGKGLICKRCKNEIPFEFYISTPLNRELREGQILLPPPRSRRHLTKPIEGDYSGIIREFDLKYFYSKYLFPQKETVIHLS